jgi:ferrochelatase
METRSRNKQCAVLLAMGGPDSLDDIGEYLFNIFSDRSIIRLPGGAALQKPFARIISTIRSRKVQSHYAKIGGSSPLLKWTRAQADQIESLIKETHPDFRCYIAMRYFRPTIEQTVRQAYRDGYRRMSFIPMYPQYSKATSGSSFMVARKVLGELPDVEARFVNDFHDWPAYISLLNEYIEENIKPDETLLFSAHSLPQKFVDEGDPYVEQVKTTAHLASGGRDYHLAFQSRTGPVKWVWPDTVEEAKRLTDEKEGNLFVVPISFVCDHIETLYEIDIELRDLLGSGKGSRLRRMPMFNDDPRFAACLAELISQKEYSDVNR